MLHLRCIAYGGVLLGVRSSRVPTSCGRLVEVTDIRLCVLVACRLLLLLLVSLLLSFRKSSLVFFFQITALLPGIPFETVEWSGAPQQGDERPPRDCQIKAAGTYLKDFQSALQKQHRHKQATEGRGEFT